MKQEKQDDGAPKPKRACKARKQAAAATGVTASQEPAAAKQGTASTAAATGGTASQDAGAVKQDLTGTSGANVEMKQEAQKKGKQDERDVEGLERNDQGLSRRVVLLSCYKWFLIALFGACCITADIDGSEQFEAVDASRDGVNSDVLQKAVQHAHDYGVHGEGLVVAYNVDRCPDLTQPAAHGAKFFFDDDARKLFITCATSFVHAAAAGDAHSQLSVFKTSHNKGVKERRLTVTGDGTISHFGDAPDVAVTAEDTKRNPLPLLIIELEMGNRNATASRRQGHVLFRRYPTLRALVVVVTPFQFNFDRVTDMEVVVVYYLREQSHGPITAKQAFDLGTVPADRAAWMAELGGDHLPPFDEASWVVCRATPRQGSEEREVELDEAIIHFPKLVVEVHASENPSLAKHVREYLRGVSHFDMQLHLSENVQEFYRHFVNLATDTKEVWALLVRMHQAAKAAFKLRANCAMPGGVTKIRLATGDGRRKLSMSRAFEYVFSGYCEQLERAGVDVAALPRRQPDPTAPQGLRFLERSKEDMVMAAEQLCQILQGMQGETSNSRRAPHSRLPLVPPLGSIFLRIMGLTLLAVQLPAAAPDTCSHASYPHHRFSRRHTRSLPSTQLQACCRRLSKLGIDEGIAMETLVEHPGASFPQLLELSVRRSAESLKLRQPRKRLLSSKSFRADLALLEQIVASLERQQMSHITTYPFPNGHNYIVSPSGPEALYPRDQHQDRLRRGVAAGRAATIHHGAANTSSSSEDLGRTAGPLTQPTSSTGSFDLQASVESSPRSHHDSPFAPPPTAAGATVPAATPPQAHSPHHALQRELSATTLNLLSLDLEDSHSLDADMDSSLPATDPAARARPRPRSDSSGSVV
ncbi:uncharacterized protein MONBRDRAFT_36477, partial [Monosiga brevicollis MX1]